MPPSEGPFVLIGQGVDDDVFKPRDEALPPIARSHPRTFMEALGFINRIKTRFGPNSQTTTECLDNLGAWRSQKFTNEQLHWHMINLFAGDHNDLLEEFERFYFASTVGTSTSVTKTPSVHGAGKVISVPPVEIPTSFFQTQPVIVDFFAPTPASLYSSVHGIPFASSNPLGPSSPNPAVQNISADVYPFVPSLPPPNPSASLSSLSSNPKRPLSNIHPMAPPTAPKHVGGKPILKSVGANPMDQFSAPNPTHEIVTKTSSRPTGNHPFDRTGGRSSGNGPYIHAICGQHFNHRNTVKSHHFGRGKDKGASGCWNRHNKPNIAWDSHPSCQTSTRCGPMATAAQLPASIQDVVRVKTMTPTPIPLPENIKNTPVPPPENVRNILVQPRNVTGNQSGRHANRNLHVLANLAAGLPRVPKGGQEHEKFEESSNVVVTENELTGHEYREKLADDKYNEEKGQLSKAAIRKLGLGLRVRH
ncbi:uncharacterized protein K441DRAFT_651172 [Cenococcum geophilum 1.58]|uniref:uncharacterized protein n=1 Tax=Cenococcum geophilum 1.58 TaxID=794803 RepID=UPI00358E0972|nr:hypothetical protein K441DRAFT_651172 [Cenococcum geophilum 1.58]